MFEIAEIKDTFKIRNKITFLKASLLIQGN